MIKGGAVELERYIEQDFDLFPLDLGWKLGVLENVLEQFSHHQVIQLYLCTTQQNLLIVDQLLLNIAVEVIFSVLLIYFGFSHYFTTELNQQLITIDPIAPVPLMMANTQQG